MRPIAAPEESRIIDVCICLLLPQPVPEEKLWHNKIIQNEALVTLYAMAGSKLGFYNFWFFPAVRRIVLGCCEGGPPLGQWVFSVLCMNLFQCHNAKNAHQRGAFVKKRGRGRKLKIPRFLAWVPGPACSKMGFRSQIHTRIRSQPVLFQGKQGA